MEVSLRRNPWHWAVRILSDFNRLMYRTKRILDASVWTALILFVLMVIVLFVVGKSYVDKEGMWEGVYVEAAGATMDIVIFGIIIAILVRLRERNREISRQEELIDDFKKWDSEEARHRIAGAVRRLNRSGRTAINFAGIELSDFSFRRHDIENIAGSTFYDGSWGTMGSRDCVVLTNVRFTSVDCAKVVFSACEPLIWFLPDNRHAIFRDCSFEQSKLQGAKFEGALMEWSEEPPDELGFWESNEDGPEIFIQEHYPPFDSTDLAGVSFKDVKFQNADFRHADNLEECEFAGATGLENSWFDTKEIKERVLLAAGQAPAK